MKKKILFALTIGVLSASLLAGCQSQPDAGAGAIDTKATPKVRPTTTMGGGGPKATTGTSAPTNAGAQ